MVETVSSYIATALIIGVGLAMGEVLCGTTEDKIYLMTTFIAFKLVLDGMNND